MVATCPFIVNMVSAFIQPRKRQDNRWKKARWSVIEEHVLEQRAACWGLNTMQLWLKQDKQQITWELKSSQATLHGVFVLRKESSCRSDKERPCANNYLMIIRLEFLNMPSLIQFQFFLSSLSCCWYYIYIYILRYKQHFKMYLYVNSTYILLQLIYD